MVANVMTISLFISDVEGKTFSRRRRLNEVFIILIYFSDTQKQQSQATFIVYLNSRTSLDLVKSKDKTLQTTVTFVRVFN